MTIKVLKSVYQSWIDMDKKLSPLKHNDYRHVAELRDYHDAVKPVFNRPGLYYDSARQVVWEEVLIDGKVEAFITTTVKQFKYDLYRLHLEELPHSLQQLASMKQSKWVDDLLIFRTQTKQLARDKFRLRRRIATMRG